MHRIRLLGPWKYTSGTIQGTAKAPFSWSEIGGQLSDAVIVSRKFHCPTNLDRDEQVFVSIKGISSGGKSLLNGVTIGDFQCESDPEFEVTKRLAKFNCLEIHLHTNGISDPTTRVFEEIALEIRSD